MIVCNTSPLIALAILDEVELLDALFGEWLVPSAAARESTVDRKPFSERLAEKLRGHVVKLRDGRVADVLNLSLDRGEAEVLALAEEKRCDMVLIDDRKGRRTARVRGLRVVGTIGVLCGQSAVDWWRRCALCSTGWSRTIFALAKSLSPKRWSWPGNERCPITTPLEVMSRLYVSKPKLSKALLEVWEMKRTVNWETKHLSGAAYFRYIHEEAVRLFPHIGYRTVRRRTA